MNNFRLQCKKIFLTYKTYINIDDIKNNLNNIFKINKYIFNIKVAHELPDNGNNYRHTHVLLLLNKKSDIKNPNKLNINNIHGDYKPVNTNEHFINIYNYLDKQNGKFDKGVPYVEVNFKLGCKYNDIDLEELKINQYKDLKKIIQSHKSKHSLWNDNKLCNGTIARCMKWTEKMYQYKPNNIKLFEHDKLLDRQQEWIDILENQNNREILFIVGDKIGKSQCCNWLLDNKDTYFLSGGKYCDIFHGYDNQEYIIFDLPKSNENFCPYRAMESFKDGRSTSSKYQSHTKVFGTKKIIVFCNFMPDTTAMLSDRYNIRKYKNDDPDIQTIKIKVFKIKNRKTKPSRKVNFLRASLNTIRGRDNIRSYSTNNDDDYK